ncbi:VWA domain-containing protein [Streptomyces sp. NPDC002889]|uniref:vWA domain-containing protein n=1 Tax=Streptomyces sp. NPDC002889 TaxID=3364669 RepID=UPI0036977CE8
MKARLRRRATAATIGAALLTLAAGPLPTAGAAERSGPGERAPHGDGRSGLVMVLDSSGSMADDDGTGRTRMESARTAVGTVVDALPSGFPTGLRVYGADQPKGCTDTRLALPVRPLDRAGMKQAVGAVQPKGDTPIGLSLQKAAQDLPKPADGTIGARTILLVSDGDDNCAGSGGPQPCEVAGQLAKDGIGLRIDTVGFQVRGAARQQLECIARAGNGRYYDAPDAKALARQLQRSAQLSADGYRFRGKPVEGTPTRDAAPALTPGQYLDTIGPGEKRYYAVDLDGTSTVDFSATAVPHPGAAVDTLDALRTKITYGTGSACESSSEHFFQEEGATPLTSAVARIPSPKGSGGCDKAGRYWLVVERESKPGSDAARWPLELMYGVEEPLATGVTPAQSQPEYGKGDKDAALPTGNPQDVTGGTGFNDAKQIGQGVWRDRLLPSQTLWYKVPVGWGQQLRYDVEFANEPTVQGASSVWSYGATQVFTPARAPVGGGTGEFNPQTIYNGRPMALKMGTVPVAWTNRHESHPNVIPVHTKGGFYIAVTLGAKAAEIAENPRIGVVLRVAVLGTELAGPQHDAPTLGERDDEGAAGLADKKGDSPTGADSKAADGAGWSGVVIAGAVGGGAVLLAAVVFVLARRRTTAATGPSGYPTGTSNTGRGA